MDPDGVRAANDLEVGKSGGPSESLQVGLQGLEALRRRQRAVVGDAGVRRGQDAQLAGDDEGLVGQLVGRIGDQTAPEKLVQVSDL